MYGTLQLGFNIINPPIVCHRCTASSCPLEIPLPVGIHLHGSPSNAHTYVCILTGLRAS